MELLSRKIGYDNRIEKLYIFKDGDYCAEALNGGWTSTVDTNSRFYKYPTYVTMESLSTVRSNYVTLYTKNLMDFKYLNEIGYKNVCIDVDVTRIYSNPPTFSVPPVWAWAPANVIITMSNIGRTIYKADISNYSSKLYAFFVVSYYAHMNIYNIWFE